MTSISRVETWGNRSNSPHLVYIHFNHIILMPIFKIITYKSHLLEHTNSKSSSESMKGSLLRNKTDSVTSTFGNTPPHPTPGRWQPPSPPQSSTSVISVSFPNQPHFPTPKLSQYLPIQWLANLEQGQSTFS